MQTEKEKMLSGALYNPFDTQLVAERRQRRIILKRLNAASAEDLEARPELIRDLIPNCGAGVWIEPPFFCDYGSNITLGDNVFFNFNCVILDVAPIHVGSRVLFGPAVQIYAATHPMRAADRNTGLELGKAIEIGHDVWVGGGTIICPGVRIGARSVIGAGSVVTKDIPNDVFAAGNPCRVVRAIEA